VASTAARLKIVLAHQTLDPLVVGDHALMAKRRLHAAPAISFKLVADRSDRVQQLDIARRLQTFKAALSTNSVRFSEVNETLWWWLPLTIRFESHPAE
jgi:hypothetical protein